MSKEPLDYFRQNVRFLCSERGDISKLAAAAGIHRTHLSDILRGAAGPSLETAVAIAAALERTVDDLCSTPKKFARAS